MRWDFGREFGFEFSGLSLSYFLFSLVRRGAKRTQRFGLQLKRVISLQPPGFNQVFIASLLTILHIVQTSPGSKNPFFLLFYFLSLPFNL